jgi:hypothetical protein
LVVVQIGIAHIFMFQEVDGCISGNGVQIRIE